MVENIEMEFTQDTGLDSAAEDPDSSAEEDGERAKDSEASAEDSSQSAEPDADAAAEEDPDPDAGTEEPEPRELQLYHQLHAIFERKFESLLALRDRKSG